ncbi:hypothetical protein PHMEG_00010525 [Phytophthora megakarya]|uniref:Uncharacterized protein n=1 Tax=Phytophthora megakarya TaxID=4795 RepID=A0A225WE10_9STRA|nr:hypothetical protein PHMEG_00010525 [Phytophthora megakarya]
MGPLISQPQRPLTRWFLWTTRTNRGKHSLQKTAQESYNNDETAHYILSPVSVLKFCTNARALGCTLAKSDHKLVTAYFKLCAPHRRFYIRVTCNRETRLARTAYQRRLTTALQDDAENFSATSPQHHWDLILRHTNLSAKGFVGNQPAISNERNRIYNNTSADINLLRKTLNELLHTIQIFRLNLANQALDHLAEMIEALSELSRVVEATRALSANRRPTNTSEINTVDSLYLLT